MFGWYVLAKLAEYADAGLLAATQGMISGHSLKHLLAAGATAAFIRYCLRRRAVDNCEKD